MMYEYEGTLYNLNKFATFIKADDDSFTGKFYIEGCTKLSRIGTNAQCKDFVYNTKEERDEAWNTFFKNA